jgi:hypothetical protein
MNLNEIVGAFMNIRSEREKLAATFKSTDEALKAQQVVLEQEMLKLCAEQGADSIRTQSGTISRKVKSRFHVTDWNNFYEFVIEQKAPQLLQKRVHETNFEEFMVGREKEGLPPGINVAREYTVTVYKPSSRDAVITAPNYELLTQ